MSKIHIKDIESLNKLNSDILKLEKKIEEFQEIKELKELQQEEIRLKNKIVKYSTYDSVQIGNIMAKLMTLFEGIEYCFSKNNVSFSNYYYIKPKLDHRDIMYVYPDYKIKNIVQENPFFHNSEKKERCYLPPSNFSQDTSSLGHFKNKDIEYIQLFIDYLYEKRSSKSLEEISEKELEEILQEFLETSIELQQKEKEKIEQKRKEQIEKSKRSEFEKSCVIDRRLILNSLAYIINHYEENISAKLEKEKEWSRSPQWSELIGYHKLIINYNDKEIYFKSKIDSYGCYPDEEYCGVYIDMNKHTDICFFELKNVLSPVLKNSNYLLGFMNSIEEMYTKKQNITSEDILQLIVDISNDEKYKRKVLNNNLESHYDNFYK